MHTDAREPIVSVAPLTGFQRLGLNELLTASWREQVTELTELATAFHAADESDGSADAILDQLAVVRRRLVEIESALNRLRTRTYGRCDGCERRIPFEQLELLPELRYCRACHTPRGS